MTSWNDAVRYMKKGSARALREVHRRLNEEKWDTMDAHERAFRNDIQKLNDEAIANGAQMEFRWIHHCDDGDRAAPIAGKCLCASGRTIVLAAQLFLMDLRENQRR